MGSLWWACLYGRPYAKVKKFYFVVGWPFYKGPSRKVGVVLKNTRIYQMILKNIWLFPIAYCDAAKPLWVSFLGLEFFFKTSVTLNTNFHINLGKFVYD
jgi:hypothetical protein